MNTGNDWESLAPAWRLDMPLDAAALAHDIRCRRRRMLWLQAAEILFLPVVLGLAWALWNIDADPWWRTWDAVIVVFVLARFAVTLRTRRGLWKLDAGGVSRMLEFRTRQVQGSLRYVRVRLASLAVLAVVTAPALLHSLQTGSAWHMPAGEAAAVVAAAVVVAAYVILAVRHARNARRTLGEIQALQARLNQN